MPQWMFWTLFAGVAVYIAIWFVRMLRAEVIGSFDAVWRGAIPSEQSMTLTVRRELHGAKRVPIVYLTGRVALGMRGARLSAEEAIRLAARLDEVAREATR